MKYQLNGFYLSFVLPEGSACLGYEDSQKVRKFTGGYFLRVLKPLCPSLKGLDLRFSSFEPDGNKDGRYTVRGSPVVFLDRNDAIDKAVLSEILLASLDEYYFEYLCKALPRDSPLSGAVEMETNRLQPEEEEDLQTVPVRLPPVYTAFTIPEDHGTPTENDIRALTKTTRDFYYSCIKAKFENFQGLEVSVGHTLFGGGTPNIKYNVYIEWDITTFFSPSGEGTVPGKHWLCLLLVKTDLNTYFKQHVRALEDTPFEDATSMFIDQVALDDEKKDY